MLLSGADVHAEDTRNPYGKRGTVADSLMEKVIFFAPFYESIIDDYRADLYIKGRVNIRKKNYLIRFLPTMFRLRRGVREYLIETYSNLHFTAPDIYDQKVRAGMGTASGVWEADGRLLEYFHVNVYSSTLLYDKLLSPLAPNAGKHYIYYVDSVMGEPHDRQYKIRFVPRSKSFQLVGGYLIVSDNVWSIREVRFSGRSEMLRFSTLLRMGEVGAPDEFLPVHCDMEGSFRMLGNVIDYSYMATLEYTDIQQKQTDERRKPVKSKYDLTESYTLSTDTNAYRRDTVLFNSLRPVPLTAHEENLYRDYFLSRDTAHSYRRATNGHFVFWREVGDVLTSRYTADFKKLGTVRFSPIINPLLLSYSGSNGISYRMEFKYNRLFSGDRLLSIVPRVGYNFKQKEFYWRIRNDFDYWPAKRVSLHVEVGNGNRIYSSDVLDDLESIPDSIFDFNQIHLDYFKDQYLTLQQSWEIVNGLTLDVGLSIHRRTEAERSRFVLSDSYLSSLTRSDTEPQVSSPLLPDVSLDDILSKFRHTYTSFAPQLRLTWTPGQYYYMNGTRKVNLYSRYPTITVDWERGIKGVLKNSGRYERIEMDIQYQLPLGLMRNLYFRAGGGAFTDQEELYFVDFAYLRRSNLPTGWSDDIGGVFQLLDSRWYNSSRKYLRGHVTYEAPFLLMRHLQKYTQYVLNERLYFNMLFVPHLNPYIELGYGIGTHIFDFGVFAGFANWQYKEIGVKFTFELFNR